MVQCRSQRARDMVSGGGALFSRVVCARASSLGSVGGPSRRFGAFGLPPDGVRLGIEAAVDPFAELVLVVKARRKDGGVVDGCAGSCCAGHCWRPVRHIDSWSSLLMASAALEDVDAARIGAVPDHTPDGCANREAVVRESMVLVTRRAGEWGDGIKEMNTLCVLGRQALDYSTIGSGRIILNGLPGLASFFCDLASCSKKFVWREVQKFGSSDLCPTLSGT